MARRKGATETISREERAALYEAFKASGQSWDDLADLIAKQNPGYDRPDPTALKRIIDVRDKRRSKSSAILPQVRRALGIPPSDEYLVTFRREEVALVKAWRKLHDVRPSIAMQVLQGLEARAIAAADVAERDRQLSEDLALPALPPPK